MNELETDSTSINASAVVEAALCVSADARELRLAHGERRGVCGTVGGTSHGVSEPLTGKEVPAKV